MRNKRPLLHFFEGKTGSGVAQGWIQSMTILRRLSVCYKMASYSRSSRILILPFCANIQAGEIFA
jgi:hypothetical protein